MGIRAGAFAVRAGAFAVRHGALVVLFPIACISACAPQLADPAFQAGSRELPPGLHERVLRVDERDWTWSIYVPGDQPPDAGRPLVLILHGSGEGGRDQLEDNGWVSKADAAGFVALAPDAPPLNPDQPPNLLTNPRIWNAGQPYLTPARAAIDDLPFFDALLSDVAGRIAIDARRIYVAGHSSGGSAAFRLVAERGDIFAAAAMLASPIWTSDLSVSIRVPTLFVVGMDDPLLPLDGGSQNLLWLHRTTPPVSQILADWARAMNCDPQFVVLSDDDDAQIGNFGTCADGTPLRAIFVKGQGHGWPGGGTPQLPAWLIGPAARTVDATQVIWEFFESAERPDHPRGAR